MNIPETPHTMPARDKAYWKRIALQGRHAICTPCYKRLHPYARSSYASPTAPGRQPPPGSRHPDAQEHNARPISRVSSSLRRFYKLRHQLSGYFPSQDAAQSASEHTSHRLLRYCSDSGPRVASSVASLETTFNIGLPPSVAGARLRYKCNLNRLLTKPPEGHDPVCD